MDQLLIILKEINIAQIIVVLVAGWFFYKRLDAKFDKIDAKFDKIDAKFDKIDTRFDKVDARIDKLSDKIEDLDRRLCRIEGSLATQGHCLISQRQQDKKAE